MPHYKLSNHDPRFLTHGLGLIRVLPTVTKHESKIYQAVVVPTNKNSVLSSLILNHPFPHCVNALFHSLYSINLSGVAEWFKTQIQLRIISKTVNIGKIMFHDLKQLQRICYE